MRISFLQGFKWILVIFVLVVSTSVVPGQRDEPRLVDTYIKDHMAAEKIPGIAVAVMREGKIVLAKGYGLANVEHSIPVRPETIFQSGSLGKAFTVFAITLIYARVRLELVRSRLVRAEEDAVDLGVDDRTEA